MVSKCNQPLPCWFLSLNLRSPASAAVAQVPFEGGHVAEWVATTMTHHLGSDERFGFLQINVHASFRLKLRDDAVDLPEKTRREGVPVLLVFQARGVKVERDDVQVKLPHGRDGVEAHLEAWQLRVLASLFFGPLPPPHGHVAELRYMLPPQVFDGLKLRVGGEHQQMLACLGKFVQDEHTASSHIIAYRQRKLLQLGVLLKEA
mmetsp:Transcript_30520/g.86305  ORF Transcript_30520/g.86305 Transcript_30520/m.86305 type:complete len:204 (-) Transcript_30520:1453-2064(-)